MSHSVLGPALGSAALALSTAVAAFAAPPGIPDQVPYSAVVPGGGARPVDLTLRIYDAASSGTLLYVQDFADVPLTDGAFTLALGPTGRANDTPANPLTTSLVTALAGDLAATAPGRFIEVTVNTDPPLPRERVLAVPFALRAETAESADSAEIAAEVSQVGGLPPELLTQIYENFNFDGGPANTDPLEGTADTDSDGRWNFIDGDNDGDGQSDGAEVSQGSHINRITPLITGFQPSMLPFGTEATVQVQGNFFEPGITVVFGSQTPTPTNVTANSFEVLVGPQSGLANVTVTRTNGESDTASFNFGEAVAIQHSLTAVNPLFLDFDVSTNVLLVGRGGTHSVRLNAQPFSTSYSNLGAVAFNPAGRIGTAGRLYAVDQDGDFELADETAVVIEPGSSTVARASLVFDASGRPVFGYLRTGQGTQAMLARDLTGDGDFADAAELVQIQTYSGSIVRRSELALDASGRAAFFYVVGAGNTWVAYDRSGDGDFNDSVGGTPEIALVTGGSGDTDCFGVTFTSAGRLALAYQKPSNSAAVLARDGNGDGDVNDAGERVELGSATVCDVERTAAGGLDFVVGGAGLVRLRDENDDGEFADPGESTNILQPATTVTAVEIGDDSWIATERNAYFVP